MITLQEAYINALASDSWRDARWVDSVFGIVVKPVSEVHWHIYLDPEKGWLCNHPTQGYIKLTGVPSKEAPPMEAIDSVDLPKGTWTELDRSPDEVILTTAGNAFLNRLSNYGLGPDIRIDYMHGKITAPQLEGMLVRMIKDDEEWDESRKDREIKASNLSKVMNAYFACLAYSDLFVPSISEKMMIPPPGIQKRKAELLKENEGKLDDPSVIAGIIAELGKLIDEYLEGDLGLNLAINRTKVIRISYMKRMGMVGGTTAFRSDGKMSIIKSDLYSGIDYADFPALHSDARVGSHKRGAETALGGEWTKFVYRVMQSTVVVPEFCGTKVTKRALLDEGTESSYINLYTKVNGKPFLMDHEFVMKNSGKVIEVYSQKHCEIGAPSYCGICAGKAMADRPDGSPQVTSDVGSLFMGLSMSAMHGKELKTVKMKWREHLI